MILDPTLLLVIGAATAGGAIASHLPGIASWLGSKMTAGKAAAQTVEAKVESAAGSVMSALAHPITTIENADHTVVLKVAEEAGRLAAYLTDRTPEQAKVRAVNAVIEAKNKALDDLIAKLQAARQQ
jgi:hypothetical protein